MDDSDQKVEKNKNCVNWQVNKNNDYIQSGDTNKTDVLLFSDLILNIDLVKKGKVSNTTNI